MDLLYEKNIKDDIIDTMEKWARVRKAGEEKPYLRDALYIRKILDNRFELSKNEKWQVLKTIERKILDDYNIEWLKEYAQECSSLWQFNE